MDRIVSDNVPSDSRLNLDFLYKNDIYFYRFSLAEFPGCHVPDDPNIGSTATVQRTVFVGTMLTKAELAAQTTHRFGSFMQRCVRSKCRESSSRETCYTVTGSHNFPINLLRHCPATRIFYIAHIMKLFTCGPLVFNQALIIR